MNNTEVIIKKHSQIYSHRHWIVGGVFLFSWVFIIFCIDYDLTKVVLLHPIRDFDYFIFFPLASILAAWVIRDKRKDKELEFHVFSGNLGDYYAEEDEKHRQTKQDNISGSINSLNDKSKFDSFMYLGSLLLGAYSAICLARAVIEKSCS